MSWGSFRTDIPHFVTSQVPNKLLMANIVDSQRTTANAPWAVVELMSFLALSADPSLGIPS